MRGVEDCVLRPEAGEEEWEAAEREHADGIDREGDGHVLAQAAHAADVLLAGAAVDDGACAEEEQGFEEGVGDEVEHADGDSADSEAHHHVAELRDGGVSEDALDVPLRHGDGGTEEGGNCADPGDDLQGHGGGERGGWVGGHQRINARDEEDTGGDHGGGVDERADGGGAFHRVGQPDVQWDLAGFARRSAEDEDADGGGDGEAEDGGLCDKVGEGGGFEGAGAGVVEEQRAGLGVEPDHADQESEVADAGGDEGFLRGGGGFGLGVPEADEEVRGEADDLPAHEEEEQAVGDDDAEHGSGEERQETEEAGEVLVVLHVADAVDEDKQADEGDHDQHDRGERVEHPAELEPFIAELEPAEVAGLDLWIPEGVGEGAESEEERQRHGADGEGGSGYAAALFEECGDSGCEDRQGRNEPKVLNDPGH
jgi:hypothetical protein